MNNGRPLSGIKGEDEENKQQQTIKILKEKEKEMQRPGSEARLRLWTLQGAPVL